MQRKPPCIDRWEKILSQPRHEKHGGRSETHKQDYDSASVPEAHRQQVTVTFPKCLKSAVELAINRTEDTEYRIAAP
jgi:hypothetical protein